MASFVNSLISSIGASLQHVTPCKYGLLSNKRAFWHVTSRISLPARRPAPDHTPPPPSIPAASTWPHPDLTMSPVTLLNKTPPPPYTAAASTWPHPDLRMSPVTLLSILPRRTEFPHSILIVAKQAMKKRMKSSTPTSLRSLTPWAVLYTNLLEELDTLGPFNPGTVLEKYEKALHNATLAVWPGCYSNYK